MDGERWRGPGCCLFLIKVIEGMVVYGNWLLQSGGSREAAEVWPESRLERQCGTNGEDLNATKGL